MIEHIDELIDLYALDALEPADMERVDEHVQRCARCQAMLAERRRVVELLAWTPEQVEPPAHLKAKVLQRIERLSDRPATPAPLPKLIPVRSSPRPIWRPVLRALSLAAALVALVLAGQLFVENRTLRQQVAELDRIAYQQETLLEMLRARDARVISMDAQPNAPSAIGRVIVEPTNNEVYLIAAGLPELPEDKAFQLWLESGDQQISAGVFRDDGMGGAATHVYTPQPMQNYTSCNITIEPEMGSDRPTGERILQTKFNVYNSK